MNTELVKLSEEEILALPLDRLAFLVLRHIADTKEWNAHNFMNGGRSLNLKDNVLRCWAEGLNWLITHNLVAGDPLYPGSGNKIFVTRLGNRVLEEGSKFLGRSSHLESFESADK